MGEKYYNIKFFSYVIDLEENNKLQDDINGINSKVYIIKKEVELLEKLIKLSDEEISKTKSDVDYQILVSDKEYFNNCLKKNKKRMIDYGTLVIKRNKDKMEYDSFASHVKYYNDNIDNINGIIKKYNYDIIYNEHNEIDLNSISEFKNSIWHIIAYAKGNTNLNIDINKLSDEYNDLCNIENYHINDILKKKLKIEKEDNNDEYIDFIFKNIENPKIIESNQKIDDYDNDENYNDFIYDMDYTKSSKKSHKITRIKKSSKWGKIKTSLKKNMRKVIAGILVGVTMIGLSGITVGVEKSPIKRNENIVVNQKVEYNTSLDNVDKVENKTKNEINDITIGSKVSVSSSIYSTAYNAYNETNDMNIYYDTSDSREVSMICYQNELGETEIVNKDNKYRINELKNLKYNVIAYCVDNLTHNVDYEGWYNIDDVKTLSK